MKMRCKRDWVREAENSLEAISKPKTEGGVREYLSRPVISWVWGVPEGNAQTKNADKVLVGKKHAGEKLKVLGPKDAKLEPEKN